MKTILILTTNRADFSHLYLTVKALKESPVFNTVFAAAGSHFDRERGNTMAELLNEGIKPDCTIRAKLLSASPSGMNRFLNTLRKRLRTLIKMNKADYVMVLGDRIELLPVIDLSLTEGFKLIHISGGERTEGVIDDRVRNMLSVNADYHFTSSEYFAEQVKKVAKQYSVIINAGDPALELIDSIDVTGRQDTCLITGLDPDSKYAVMTFHPETAGNTPVKAQFEGISHFLENTEMNVICTAPNSDAGGDYILGRIKNIAGSRKNIRLCESLGFRNYISVLKHSVCAIGNSSSLIIEAPYMGIPSVLTGIRQKGRPLASSIIECSNDYISVRAGIDKALELSINRDNLKLYYERRDTSMIIRRELEQRLIKDIKGF